ncbi:hypothetical protein IV203_023700 [Nitzschia inconspicua]|uniref:Uncharacterized protein n=1 Tax=Nitzschia inconspicua TaxID=303405 RepID=A0A9K3KDK2_9STRA|nr:hypothetical protein IV203_023700 [Nitzschia inconspicua]
MKSLTVRELVLEDTESCCSDVSCDDLLEDDANCTQRQESFLSSTQSLIVRNLRWEAGNHSKHSVDSPPICYGNERKRPAERSYISKDVPFRAPVRSTERLGESEGEFATSSSPSLSRWSSQSSPMINDKLQQSPLPPTPPCRRLRSSSCEDTTAALRRTMSLLDAALEISQNCL